MSVEEIKKAVPDAALSAVESKPDFWDVEEARENKLATVVAPDNGTTAEVLSAVLECAEAWVPEARIIGNVRAGDIARVVRSALSAQVQDVAGIRAQAIEDVLSALVAHELYQYRPKAFAGFIEYARSTLINDEDGKLWRADASPASKDGEEG